MEKNESVEESKRRKRISVRDKMHRELVDVSKKRGVTTTRLTEDALTWYLTQK